MMMRMNSAAGRRSIIGLDIGGTKIACVEGGFDGRIHRRSEIPTCAARPFVQTFPAVRDLERAVDLAVGERLARHLANLANARRRVFLGLRCNPIHHRQ